MPGMMDTVLNLGLNDDSVQGLIAQTQNPRFAWDSYRRFIQMFSNVVMGVDADLFENALTQARLVADVRVDSELSAEDLQELVETFKGIFSENVEAALYPELEVVDGKPVFPHDPELQLRLAIQAVFGSWMNERACIYRKQHGISDELGTAVNVQAMAFGNKGETSATGVAFTRNPADGTKEFYGDFLVNAQGEDVVAGIRNTEPIADLKATPGLESVGEELERVFLTLEDHYRDMCDIEFTIEQGKLWMLQTRVGKRTATAALRIAIEMVEEGLITREEAVSRIDPAQLDQLLHPQFDASEKYEALASGRNASPGAAVGEVVFSSDDAVARSAEGHKVILVRWETNPDDLKGMVAAEGILTSADFEQAQETGDGMGVAIYRTDSSEMVMAVCCLVPYAAEDVAAMRLVTSLTLVQNQLKNVFLISIVVVITILGFTVASGLYFVRSIVVPLGQVERTAASIARGELDVRLPVTGDARDEVDRLRGTINRMAEGLEETEKMKNEFISSVSHELRTPLTSIRGWVETLRTLDDPEDENYRKGLEIINNETARLYNMVEELLDFSRLQNGRLKMSCHPLDLVAELTDAVLFCEARTQREGLLLSYSEPEEMIPVYADPNRLRQVFINILDNAIKYSAPGGRITVKIWQGEYKAFIEIIDQGRGIPPEDLENVKTKFYKGSNSVRGSGIGLALVDSIMTALDGTLDLKSTLGRGTVVTLGLPIYKR